MLRGHALGFARAELATKDINQSPLHCSGYSCHLSRVSLISNQVYKLTSQFHQSSLRVEAKQKYARRF